MTREAYDAVQEAANKETGTDLGAMVRVLVEEAIEARMVSMVDSPDAKMYLHLYYMRKHREKERILHDIYVGYVQAGAENKEQETDMIAYAEKHGLQYPPLNVDAVNADPNLRKIMIKLSEEKRLRAREIYNSCHMLKDDCMYYLSKLEKMGKVITEAGSNNTVWVTLVENDTVATV